MKAKFIRFPLLALALSPSLMAGAFIWTGASNGTWTDSTSTPLNWDIVSTPPTSTDIYPNYGSTYASDFLNIRNNGDLTAVVPGVTPGADAVYNPGVGVTTTFGSTTAGGRGFVIGTGNGPSATPPNVKGYAKLTVSSGTIAVVRNTNTGSEAYMANRADSTLHINGGAVDLSAHLNNFRLIQEGFTDANGPIESTITITSGSLSCNLLDLVYDTEVDPTTVFGIGTINLNGGVLALTRFNRTAASDPGQTTFTINLNGGTLRCRNANANFLPALADTQTLVKAGGAIIDTNTFSSTIAEDLEHDSTLDPALDGGLTKNNTGALTLSGTSTYNGGTTINAGSVIISSDANLGASTGGINFNATGSSSNLNITASIESSNRIVNLASTAIGNIQLGGGVSYTNSGKFTGSGNLRFRRTGTGARTATLASLSNDFTGSLTIDQENTSEQISVTVNSLSDPVGAGNIICGALNTSTFPSFRLGVDATGGLTLDNRRIELAGVMNTGSFFIIGNDNITNPIIINSDLLVSGTAGTRRLSLSGVAGPVNEFAGDIADGGSVVSVTKGSNAAVWTLSGNNSHTGGTTLGGGTSGSQLNINSPTALGTGTFSVTGGDSGKIDNTSGAPLTVSTNNAQAWNNNITFVGTNNLNLGNGAVTLGGNRTIFVQGSTLTVGGAISGAFNITKGSTGGTLVLTGSSTYTGATVISGGTLSISSIADYGASSAIGAPLSGAIQLGAANNFCGLTYTGPSASTNRTVQLGDATAANTGVGTIKNNGSGALTFSAANFNPTITGITATRTLWLGGSYTGGANEIQGIIQDNDAGGKVNVGKANDANTTWLLSGVNTYTGSTIVQGGTLKLGASASIASSSSVSISAGAVLDTTAKATYTTGAQPLAFGIDATSSGSSGKIAAAGLNVSSAVVTYNITGTPDDPTYVLATYTGTLIGTFASVDAPPAGYTLNYAYEGNKIALVQSVGSPYDTWSGGAAFDADANGDGVKNGLAFLLGAANPNANALALLPVVTQSGGGLILTFNCLNSASRGTVVLNVEHSSNLGISDPWATVAVPEIGGGPTSGVTFAVTPGSPTNAVTATISSSEAASGKLFGRLKAVKTP